MRRNLVPQTLSLSVLGGLLLLSFPGPAIAAEPQPGAACSTAEVFARIGGPENPGSGHFMVCTGGVWMNVIDYLSASGYVGIKQAVPAAPLHVGGEAIIGTTGLACSATIAGAMRYSSSTVTYCNGSAWTAFGGGGTPAGADTQIQFNSGGAFGGDADFVWNSGSNILTITGRASISDRVSLGATAGAAAPISGNVSTLAGAPGATLCNSPEEYGRLIIDSTNNRLYICTTTRGWDYVALTD